jgi:hypothetical protein
MAQILAPTASFIVFKTRSQKSLCAPYVIKKKWTVFSISGHVLKTEKLIHPLCDREKVVIISISGHVLKPEKLIRPLCDGNWKWKKLPLFSISGHVLTVSNFSV